MGERKVLNKYYPPDFDPAALPREKRRKDPQEAVRFMLPMTVRCDSCGGFMYAGTKFNAKKELVSGETYHGIRIFRFFLKCIACAAHFAIRTDPKNADYQCESGATRNFERWKAPLDGADADAAGNQEESAVGADGRTGVAAEEDAVTALESKAARAKRQMEQLNELEALRASSARRAQAAEALQKSVRGSWPQPTAPDAAIVARPNNAAEQELERQAIDEFARLKRQRILELEARTQRIAVPPKFATLPHRPRMHQPDTSVVACTRDDGKNVYSQSRRNESSALNSLAVLGEQGDAASSSSDASKL
eukprot:CAMPEP_0185841488 /NCGR_PEP_ID=MMETSP1353-20130828/17920_1 /TAXON_ID=1077150 /ORGANISM="Erythrolobus australicus, Strain CCMP3124" /LENGTH=306 /DNA_ID=CAMNT_0028540967 /DNA_START=21 /DNA_END=941 /DNA_ORIENTATION=+